MIINKSEKKFQIGVNNQQCIGPCYKPGTMVTHPITLKPFTDRNHPFCPTRQWMDNGVEKILDTCLIPTDDKYIGEIDIESYILPTFPFSCEYFLKTYYDIYSFENAIEMITNNKNHLNTNLRIINCAWKSFGSSTDIFNENLISFYMNLIKKEWMKDIYVEIYNYITVDKNNIYLGNNNDDISKFQVEKINYFNKKFNNLQIIYKALVNYIDENRSNWNDIRDHNKKIKQYLIEFIKNKIINTIKNE